MSQVVGGDEHKDGKRMYTIFGSPRSGTTLLAELIGAHPDFFTVSEPDLMSFAALVLTTVPEPEIGKRLIMDYVRGSARIRDAFPDLIADEEVADALHRSSYDANIVANIFERIARGLGIKAAGSKAPNDLLMIRTIDDAGLLGSGMKVIHIVRDIRDAMVSLDEQEWGVGLEALHPRLWSATNVYLHERLKGHDHYRLVRYEDLVASPENVLAPVFALLGASWDEGVLDPERWQARFKDMPHHVNLRRPVGTFSVGRHTKWDRARLEAIEHQSREGLERFGYLASERDEGHAARPAARVS